MSISRCTQTPTFMEELRKGWHPERMSTKGASSNVLVIGAGPAGLEAARAAAERGYDVALAETGTVGWSHGIDVILPASVRGVA